jgi:hypothetical protein
MEKRLSTRAMARELGVSGPLVCRMAKAGMPMDDPAKAREWRALYVRPMRRPELGQVVRDNDNDRDHGRDQRAPNIVDLYATEAGEGQLEDTIPRLRRLEKATAVALEGV